MKQKSKSLKEKAVRMMKEAETLWLSLVNKGANQEVFQVIYSNETSLLKSILFEKGVSEEQATDWMNEKGFTEFEILETETSQFLANSTCPEVLDYAANNPVAYTEVELDGKVYTLVEREPSYTEETDKFANKLQATQAYSSDDASQAEEDPQLEGEPQLSTTENAQETNTPEIVMEAEAETQVETQKDFSQEVEALGIRLSNMEESIEALGEKLKNSLDFAQEKENSSVSSKALEDLKNELLSEFSQQMTDLQNAIAGQSALYAVAFKEPEVTETLSYFEKEIQRGETLL